METPTSTPGTTPMEEQLAHRDPAPVHVGVDQHRHAGRDDRSHHRRSRYHRRHEPTRVALTHHARGQHRPDGRALGQRHARHAGEQHAGQHDHVGQAAPQVAHQAVGKIDQLGQHATALHEIARDDEERDGEQREGVHAPEHQRGQDGDRHGARQHDEGQAAQPQTEGDGHAQRHGQREDDDEKDDQHAVTAPRRAAAHARRCRSREGAPR